MKSMMKALLAAGLLCAAHGVQAQQSWEPMDEAPSAAAMVFDVVLVRPLSLVATVLGTGFFIVQLPFSALSGVSPGVPAQRLIGEPAAYTFTRPLGEMR